MEGRRAVGLATVAAAVAPVDLRVAGIVRDSSLVVRQLEVPVGSLWYILTGQHVRLNSLGDGRAC